VFPTVSDAFGLVMLEAMACGVPVIATEHSGAPEVMRDGESGYVVPACDDEALADRMAGLIEEAELRRSMGEKARQRVVSMYTWEHYKRRIRSAYAEILGRPVASGAAPHTLM
jgi:glycosyltransferase involved in cell wall biosynthesis